MGYFRDMKCELKWLAEELWLLAKHPSRKATYLDISYHWSKLWDYTLFHPWYCLKRGIKNFWSWKGMIWRLDSWDWFFLADMMDKQLKDMESLWETRYVVEEREYAAKPKDEGMEKGFRCQHRRIWKRIRWTRKLMGMWRDEHYAMKAYDEHTKKFPRASLFLEDENIAKTTYDEYGVPILYECKPRAEDERVDYRLTSEQARLMDEKCFKLWQKNLGNIRNWWQ